MEVGVGLSRCCDIILEQFTKKLGFCPACRCCLFVVVHMCLINAAVTGRLSTLSSTLKSLQNRGEKSDFMKKRPHNLCNSEQKESLSLCLCLSATAADALRVRGAVCFVSSHYIANEPPSGGRARGTVRQTEK